MKELLTLVSPVYRVYLILVFTSINYVHSQSWTFNNPGISYIGFSPQYSSGQSQNIELKFRTRQPNGLLFHHYLLPFDKNKFPLLYHYELYAEIRQGYLRVGHQVNQYSQLLTLGQGLNDDKWHTLSWDLDSSDGLMSVKLDNETKSLSLEVYGWGSGKEILKWSQLPSIISFGSTNMSESQDFFYFIGCLADLKYSREDGILIAVPIQKISGVTQGCNDLCSTETNPCQNGGRCINMYTTTKCDCFGTNYEGSKCENKGATTMTFRGYEWIQYKLYNRKEDKLFSDENRISLEFKTGRGSGILLYAVGGTPYHTHVTATLHSGKLHTSISFGDDTNDLEFTLGLQLDNDRWHNLTIVHDKRDIYVYLDGVSKYKEVTAEQHFLSLDPNVYIGGGDNFVETRGLQVTRSFVGCLRNVYFNDDSVLHSLKTGKDNCEYQGGRSAQYGCDAIQEIPITFPIAGSMLQWDVPREKELSVSFRFRTVREVAVLFSIELLARDGLGGYEYGYLEVWVKDGRPFLDFVPSTRNKDSFRENQSIPSLVNNSQWHTLDLSLHSRQPQDFFNTSQYSFQAKLKVDQVSIRTNVYRKTLEHQGKLVFGYGIGLRRYKRSEGFVGCIEGLVIQGKSIDPISIMESDRAVGLVLDGCNLIDYCSNNNICQHGSVCLSDWDGVRCDCSEHYEGKACHFAKYPRTCDEYFQSGRNMSGIYMVDLDGSGPLLPTHVHCDMGGIHDQHEYGETIIEHNFHPNTTVRRSSYADRQYHLSYRGMSAAQLYALTSVSARCEQYIKYECYSSPMGLGKKTWFKAANGEIVDYIGSNRAGFCNCLPGEEMCSGERCYCDRGLKEWDQDSGINKNKAQLPLTEVTVLQYPTGIGNLTIGHLKCWGSVQVPLDKSITFIKSSSYVMLHSWKSGDLRINIKTDQTDALILYQTPGKGMGNKLSVKIVSANEVQFHFVINGKSILKTIYTPISFDTGEWHTIMVEHDRYNLRLSVDQSRSLYTIRSDIDELIDFSDGILYIGGLPDGIAGELGETSPGLTGCVRGFVYNKKEKDLSRLIDGSMTGVTTDCMSSCWPNPCLNGGVCEENWGSYNCICANKWIHYGNDCERDINRDAVTLTGTETSFMVFDTSEYPEALHETVIFSFRTFKQEALVLYIHDEMNNFVQFEVQKGTTLIISYNNFNEVIRESITFNIEHKLSDGKWKQVIAEITGDSTRLQVEDKTLLIHDPRLKLRNYNTFPYKESRIPESVFLPRPSEKPVPFVHLYVGGVPKGATTLSTFNGCLRGLKIGKRIYNLREQGVKAKAGDVTTACETGCIEDRCLNGGYCSEYFKLGEYECDCSETDYSGQQCEIEPSGKFDGNSVIQQKFSLPLIDQRSLSEQLSFTFMSDGVDPSLFVKGEIIEMAMIYVTSSKKKDYLLAKLEQDGSVMIETNQEIGIYRMKIPVDFANGKAHELQYKRDGSDMYVTIDGIEEATMNYAAFDLDDIDSIYVGGMAQQTDDFYSVVNFTGCISNVVYTPSKTSSVRIRPLKDFYTNYTDIKVLGNSVSTCSGKRPNIDRSKSSHTPNPPPDEFTDFETVTMPEWDIGPAQVEIIGGIPVPPTNMITTTQSLFINRNNTSPLLTDYRVDNMTIVITASIIALCLILAIIIALLLVRRRRRLGEYELKKKIIMDGDLDAKVPLNQVPLNHVTSTPVPADHLAKLDEFSMVSATLGPPKMRNNVGHEPTNRFSQGSFPMIDDETAFTSAIYNKRKNRPASSISEVLEELERRQKNIKDPITDEICKELEENLKRELELNRTHGEGELEWDPQIDKAPLTYKKEEDDIVTEGSENPNSNGEYNGDSGYEAESSRPEGLESIDDSATPDTTIDESPTKFYYDISGIELHDSPNLSVHQKLLPADTKT